MGDYSEGSGQDVSSIPQIEIEKTYAEFLSFFKTHVLIAEPSPVLWSVQTASIPNEYTLYASSRHIIVSCYLTNAGEVSNFESNYLALSNKPIHKTIFKEYLTQGSDIDMDVNGSGTSEVFDFDALANETIVIEDVLFWSFDSRHLLDRFGNVNNISDGDGFQLYYHKDSGSEEYIVNDGVDSSVMLQETTELQIAMDNNMRVNSRQSNAQLIIHYPLKHPKVLESGTADLFGARIRANLTGMDGLRVKIMGYKVSI